MSEQTEQQLEASQQRASAANERTAKGGEQLADALKHLVDLYEDEEYVKKSAIRQFGELNKSLISGRRRLTEVSEDLASLKDTIEKLEESAEKTELKKQLQEKLNEAKRAQAAELAVKTVSQAAMGYAKVLYSVSKSAVSSYQSNASAFQTAGEGLNAEVEGYGGTVKNIAGVTATVGAGLMPLGGYATDAGLALVVLASAATIVSGLFTEGAQTAVNMLVKELDNTAKSFELASSTGAIFAKGLSDVRDQSVESRLTQEQYSKVVAENSAGLAAYGGNVANGAKMFVKVSGILNNEFLPRLMALGLSIDDIADGAAKYMGMIGRLGVSNTMSENQLASATANYLEQIKKITAFTGENAKQAEKEAEIAAQSAAVQAKILSIQDPQKRIEEEQKFKALIATAHGNKDLILAIQQKYTTGVISNLALLASGSETFVKQLDENVANISNNTLNVDEFNKTLVVNRQKYAQQILEEGKQNAQNMTAANVHGQKFAEVMEINAIQMADSNKALMQNGKETIEQQANAAKLNAVTPGLTESFIDAVQANQDLRIDIQKKLTPAIESFASYVPSIITRMRDKVDEAFNDLESVLKVSTGRFGGGGAPTVGTTSGGTPIAGTTDNGLQTRINDFANSVLRAGGITPYGSPNDTGRTVRGGTATVGGQSGVAGAQLITDLTGTGINYVGSRNYGITPGLLEILKSSALSGRSITGLNDHDGDHGRPTDPHYLGKAADIRIGDMSPDAVVTLLRSLGGMPNVKDVFAEGKPNDAMLGKIKERGGKTMENVDASALHVHLEALALGKNKLNPDDAYIVGERGPEIVQGSGSVTSTAATSEIFSKMLTKLDRLIAVTESHSSTTTKLLNATV